MKHTAIFKTYLLLECVALLSLAAWVSPAVAQGKVYRCQGNEYVADVKDSKNGDCKILEGGNVTVVQGPRFVPPQAAISEPIKVASIAPTKSSTSTTSTSSGSNQRSESSSEQRARDSDAKMILESELKKSENKLTELLKEYNNGDPEKNSLEAKNPQRFAERLNEMKANIARLQSDIEGIRRELGRKS